MHTIKTKSRIKGKGSKERKLKMNKLLRKVMVLALAGTMTVGMNATVFAEDSNLNTKTETLADNDDTLTINLLKDYVNGTNNQENTESPAETFIFTIERYGLWNVGEDGNGKAKYTKDNMPTFNSGTTESSSGIFKISVKAGKAGKAENTGADKSSVALTVPTYEAVGDYWYKVTETDNNVAGVIYGTNDNETDTGANDNNGHKGIYYIHVQVTNASTKGNYIRTVTLHKTAPDLSATTNAAYESWYKDNNKNSENETAKKVNDIQNKYYAGSLNITKTVTGNAGDKNELFEVKVKFTNDSNASMKSNITYKNYYDEKGNVIYNATKLIWEDGVTIQNDTITHSKETTEVSFYIKDGTTVTFDNIPYGVTYTITETQPTDDKYTHEFAYTDSQESNEGKFNGNDTKEDSVTAEKTSGTAEKKWNAASATGSITDASDTVTITNTKVSTIDVGVITSNAPYVAMLLLVAAAAFVFVHRRKNMIEE